MTNIKICGITNLEDALFAAKAGADALGFNFFEHSSRYITVDRAQFIVGQLPAGVRKVGVFVNADIEKVLGIAQALPLDAIQLHGDESPDYVGELKEKIPQRVIKALRVSGSFKPESVRNFDLDTLILDTYSPAEYGGTGETFDWDIARAVKELGIRVYLAGGLSPDNVRAAIRAVRPYGVDACSCLERAKGLKDNIKIKAFIQAVKGVQ